MRCEPTNVWGLALAMLLSGCPASPNAEPRWFSSPEPELGSQGAYVGKLALHDGCVVMLIEGELTASNAAEASTAERVVPLFGAGFDVRGTNDDFEVISPVGQAFGTGQIITGEGIRYPVSTTTNSRPVAPPPDISECGTVPFQVRTMSPGSL